MAEKSRTVAIVTGGGSGIGRAIAHRFGRSGASVVINDIHEEAARTVQREVEDLGSEATVHVGDVSTESDVLSLAETVRSYHGQVDVLVNNAGIGAPDIPTVDQRLEDWQRVVDVCMRGPYLVCQRLGAEFMLPRRRGAIINIASAAGIIALPRANAYSAAKAGVIMMTRSLGSEWGRYGITVNAVAPGYIETPLLNSRMAKAGVDGKAVTRRIPSGRMGSPDDIASAVHYLASAEARYINGITLTVDGGFSAGVGGSSYDMDVDADQR